MFRYTLESPSPLCMWGESRASVSWIGLFAFGQMRRLDRLADVKPTFQCPDMTARGLSLLGSVIGSESGHHVGVCGNEDPEGFPWNFRPGINEGDRFHSDGSSPNSVRSALISTLAVGVRIGQPGERESSCTLSRHSPAFSFLSIATSLGYALAVCTMYAAPGQRFRSQCAGASLDYGGAVTDDSALFLPLAKLETCIIIDTV